MSSGIPSALQLEIIARCKEHDTLKNLKRDFRRCIVFEGYFIKYGGHKSLHPQYKTQQYISELADGDASAPRVPNVYGYFTSEHSMAYLVVEHVEVSPTSVRDAPDKVAQALQWLRSLPVPPGVTIGPVGGGRARHKLFKNFRAPLPFSSKAALETYMNRAPDLYRSSRPKNISFSDEQLVFTQSDMDESNFSIDTKDNICIFDFENVGILPESFASYTLSSNNDFANMVAEYLDWPTSPNLHSMAMAGAILTMSSDSTLGLDENGRLKTRS